ncbi:unnamed protein product [Boreogadus saida]
MYRQKSVLRRPREENQRVAYWKEAADLNYGFSPREVRKGSLLFRRVLGPLGFFNSADGGLSPRDPPVTEAKKLAAAVMEAKS